MWESQDASSLACARCGGKNFLYFLKKPHTFRPKLKKIKKSTPKKNSLYFRKWNFITLRSKNFLYFLKGKLLISGNGTLHFLNSEKIIYISGNGTLLYFGKGIFRTLAHLELEAYSEPWYIQNPGKFRT